MAAETASRPEPEQDSEDHFALLGVPRRFGQDRAALERRFYELSRQLHPDRFVGADPALRMASVERMSRLNQAYNTLKDPEARRAYLLQLEGVAAPGSGPSGRGPGAKGGQLPMELAEDWFELQDLVLEEPSAAAAKLGVFKARLEELARLEEEKLLSHERTYDETGARNALEEISRGIQAKSYLFSMKRDVARLESGDRR